MGALQRFMTKWGSGGLERSLARKRLRREAAQLPAGVPLIADATLQSMHSAHAHQAQSPRDVKRILKDRFPASAPLPVFRVPEGDRGRVTMVTDSINAGSLYGGVGTALILAALICEAQGRTLRIVTRNEAADPRNLQQLLQIYKLELQHDPQFLHVPVGETDASADIFDDEIFITTSWWTTAATMSSVPKGSILYLLQEDERMFYAFGDERLRCEQVLGSDEIAFVVNSELLHTHLVGSGLANIERNGMWFEPAFPSDIFYRRPRTGKRRLMFYARPNNLRNLFYLGIEAIDRAVESGMLDPDNWEILLVGKDIPEVVFDNGITCARFENMRWDVYADLVGTVDLGLSLMYTPHPSYPPLDLAASGAVVVTNAFLNKQDMSRYSDNILVSSLDVDSLARTIGQGVELALNGPLRDKNHASTRIGTSWRESLAPVVDRIAR